MDALSVTMAALADPTRRAILARLKSGPATVTELCQPFRMSQQAVSKHVAYLEQARLVRKRRDGRQQICELAPAPIREVADWASDYRRHWEAAFSRLRGLLQRQKDQRERRRRRAR
ncbi:MAG: ArsR/SmtB family transcription factor [Vicinamibacteraceae bacterium]